MKLLKTLMGITLFLPLVATAANYDSATYAKLPKYGQAALSANGTYLAVQVPDTEFKSEFKKFNLAVIRLKDRKPINVIRFGLGESVSTFFWDTDKRLIIRTAEQRGSLAPKIGNPNIYAIDADGSNRKVIYGPDVVSSGSKASKAKSDNLWGEIISRLRDDPDYILVAKLGDSSGDLIKVHTTYATQKLVKKLPGLSFSDVVTTPDGEPLFFVGNDSDLKTHVYRTSNGMDGWELHQKIHFKDASIVPVSADNNGNVTYVGNIDAEPNGIFIGKSTESDKYELVYRHPIVDATPIYSQDGEFIAARTESGAPEFAFFNDKDRRAIVLKTFVDAFPQHFVNVVNLTDNHEKALVAVSSDRNWGQYYLYDFKTNKAEPLFGLTPWFDSSKLPERKPISLKARDGVVLHGYMTLPQHKEAKNLPLVVIPHGGPHGPRDGFDFDPEAAFLADNGYAVLQINFRGSGGYGPKFENSGYRKWGLSMQDDLTDATLWMVEQGIADKNRMCISGASYGGYASLMGVVKEPDLYKCAVSYVGVSDLPLMYSKGDIQRRDSGKSYLKEALGTDSDDLKARSPAYNAEKIKANVLLVHGMEDERVPPAHYQNMAKALEAAGKKPELLIKSKEAHGFVSEENRKEYFDTLLDFLHRNIGK